MTTISAPAGEAGGGKTSLLRAWADRPGQPHRVAVVQVQRDQHDAQLCEQASVRRIRVHDNTPHLRKSPAAMDVHPRVAMQILRHSKIATTMEIYTHVPSEVTRRALKQLGASLNGLGS